MQFAQITHANHYKCDGFADLHETWHIAPLILRGYVCYRSRIDGAMVKSVSAMGRVTGSDKRTTKSNVRITIS